MQYDFGAMISEFIVNEVLENYLIPPTYSVSSSNYKWLNYLKDFYGNEKDFITIRKIINDILEQLKTINTSDALYKYTTFFVADADKKHIKTLEKIILNDITTYILSVVDTIEEYIINKAVDSNILYMFLKDIVYNMPLEYNVEVIPMLQTKIKEYLKMSSLLEESSNILFYTNKMAVDALMSLNEDNSPSVYNLVNSILYTTLMLLEIEVILC